MKKIIIALIMMCTMAIMPTFAASTAATIAELVEGSKKTTESYTYKGQKYTVYVGPRGGKYICVRITRGEHKGQYRKQYIKK